VLGEAADRLAGRHRRLAALEPGEHDRLGDLGDRQLALHDRRDGAEAADARDDLGLEAEGGAQLVLLLGAAPQRRVAGVDAGDEQALAGGPLVVLADPLERVLGAVDDDRVGRACCRTSSCTSEAAQMTMSASAMRCAARR
jgi:hypothetical protein